MNNNILVVGGGSGIGKKTVEMLSSLGKSLIVADLDICNWEIGSTPGVIPIPVNVLEQRSLDMLVHRLVQMNVALSGFVYTVGEAQTKPIKIMKVAEYEKLLELNAISFLHLFGLLDKHNIFSPMGASVVVISSLVASVGARGKVGYAASKGAIEAAVKSLAIEYASKKIRVNTIAPGTVYTEMLNRLITKIGKEAVTDLEKEYPLGLGEPDDVANAIVFLLSIGSRWMTGNVCILDGAFSTK